jgi:prevent-host-death family protein
MHAPVDSLKKWDQQQAKAKFSEVVRRARSEGPQLVTTRGVNAVVVISADEYAALAAKRPLTFNDLRFPCEGFEPVRADYPAIYEPFTF